MAKNKNLEANQPNKNPNVPVSDEKLKKLKTKRITIIALLSVLAIASLIAMILVLVFVKKQ